MNQNCLGVIEPIQLRPVGTKEAVTYDIQTWFDILRYFKRPRPSEIAFSIEDYLGIKLRDLKLGYGILEHKLESMSTD